jgi:hypothetical protein
MAKNEKVIEDALFQIKNLEEALKRNAQGILSSTMKEEINSLVKESLKEQDEVEDEEEVEDEMDIDTDIEMDLDTDNEDEMDDEEDLDLGDDDMEDLDLGNDDMEYDMSMDSDEDDTIDLTGASDDEVLRVFKAMGDNDGVIVKQDDNMIHLSDNENDTEYLIQLGESEMDDFSDRRNFGRNAKSSFKDDEFGFEDDFDFSELDEMNFSGTEEDEDEFSEFDKLTFSDDDDDDDVVYELEMEDDDMDEFSESMSFSDDETEYEDEMMFESKKGFKSKGVGMGSSSKYKMSKKPNMDGGFKTVKKSANKTMGTGKAKFEYKEEVNMMKDSKMKKPIVKKTETKEASRTYGNGSKEGRGLRKGITPNRNLTFENSQELEMLRTKNEEYRKALDLFRTKLNEVAVFNSNLAYATRLFTEHSTTKQEKINILRRFDNVDTLKESKTLYKVIKDELGNDSTNEKTISESFERTVTKSPVTGSAVNLIESKTYENPQFLRMKDLMGKIK